MIEMGAIYPLRNGDRLMIVSRSEVFGITLLFLCALALVLLFITERWTVPIRMKLGIVLVVVAACSILGMYH